MESFLGSGDGYLELMTAGKGTGLKLAGNITKLEITPDGDLKEQTSKGRNSYGQVIASAVLPKPTKVVIDLNQLDPDTVAMAVMGDKVVINEAGGDVTGEALTLATEGWFDLTKRNLSDSGLVVTLKETPATTYALGEDFEVHYRLGMIRRLSGGAIPSDAAILVDYTHQAVSGSRVRGAVQPVIEARIVLDGKNYVTERDVTVVVYKARLKPTSAIDFLADDFTALSLEGTCIVPEGKDEPFHVDFLD